MISPASIRDANWQEIRDRLDGQRMTIYNELSRVGRATTREIADSLQLDVLTVRPRVTELVQLGFARCVGRDGRDGVYVSIPYETVRASREQPAERQLPMKLEE